VLKLGQREKASEEELILLKLRSQGLCRVASIDARQPGENEIAQKLSAQVSSMSCLSDE
jgi:hypothetical protein